MGSPVVLLILTHLSLLAPIAADTNSHQWWNGPSARWSRVHPDHNWDNRRTGVKKAWSTHFGVWSHYRPGALLRSRRPGSGRPWTTGRMCKFLREVDGESFELRSVYEESARGNWAKGALRLRSSEMRDDVPLWQMGHVFRKTPYRVTELPAALATLPPSLQGLGVESSRATIVMPDGCTVSGPRWLPTNGQAAELRRWRGEDGEKATRFQFCELWLAEGTEESEKVGAFVMYDGITGELAQVFVMREALLSTGGDVDPDESISIGGLEGSLGDEDRLSRGKVKDSAMARALRHGKCLEEAFRHSRFTSMKGRAVRTSSPDGVEEECTTTIIESGDGSDREISPMLAPLEKACPHMDCRFDDGVYLRIPRSFRPESFRDDDVVCLELGCLRRDGDFHRVRMMGSREIGGFNVCVYERWR